MTPAEIAAEVSARYGVSVCASVVQQCPPQTFTTTLPIWNGRELVYLDADERKAAWRRGMWSGATRARASAVTPEILERRAAVLRLHGDGLHNTGIALQLGFTTPTISKDVKALGLMAHAAPRLPRTEQQIKIAIVTRMHGEGATAEQVAAVLHLKPDTVRDLARVAGVKFARKVHCDPKTGQNTATVLRLQKEGMRPDEIAAAIGIIADSVRRVAARAGSPFPPKVRDGKYTVTAQMINRRNKCADETAARRMAVSNYLANGGFEVDLSTALGVHRTTILKDLKALGIAPLTKPGPIQERRAKLQSLITGGADMRQIHTLMGVSVVVCKADLRALGLPIEGLDWAAYHRKRPRLGAKARLLKAGPTKAQQAATYRQRCAQQLRTEGHSLAKICAILDAKKSTIYRDLQALGMSNLEQGQAA